MDVVPSLWVAADLADLRVLKNPAVEICCFFGLSVEPQTRRDLAGELHTVSFRRSTGYALTIVLKPPKIMRLPSNGTFLDFIIASMRLSFMTFAMTRSRSARDR